MEVFSVFIYRQIDGINVPVTKSELTTALLMSVGDGVISINSNADQPIIVGDYTFNNVQITPDE